VALAARLRPAPDDALALAAVMPRNPRRIHIRRIDRVAARIPERIQHRERRFLIRRPAKHIAAEHQRRNGNIGASQFALGLHNRLLRRLALWTRTQAESTIARSK